MLVNQTVKKGEVVAFKLTTGDEVVARLEEITETEIKIKKPLTIGLVQGPNGQPAVAPAPWVLAVEDDAVLTISRSHLIFLAKARTEMISSYTRATSGIDIASNLGNLQG